MSEQDSQPPQEENPREEQANHNPSGEAQSASTKDETPFDKKELTVPVVEFIVGIGFFGAWAELVDDRFHTWAMVLRVLGVLMAEFSVAHLIFRMCRNRGKLVWALFAFVVLAQTPILFFLKSNSDQKFRLFLSFSSNPTEIELADPLLFFPNVDHLIKMNLRGVVTVPVASNDSAIDLRFRVLNDSEVASDGLQIMVSFSDVLNAAPSRVWQPAGAAIERTKSLGVRERNDLLKRSALEFDSLTLSPTTEWAATDAPNIGKPLKKRVLSLGLRKPYSRRVPFRNQAIYRYSTKPVLTRLLHSAIHAPQPKPGLLLKWGAGEPIPGRNRDGANASANRWRATFKAQPVS